jgi:integrase
VDFTRAGKRINMSLRTRDWHKAEEILREWQESEPSASIETKPRPVDQSRIVPEPVLHKVERACIDFLEDAETRGLRPATVYKYDSLLRRLLIFCRECDLQVIENVTLDHLRQFRASLNYGNIAARKRVEELRAFFGFCKESGWISDNPAKNLKYPKVTSPPRQPFSDEEVQQIRSACSLCTQHHGHAISKNAERLTAFVELLLHTGLRIGDAVQVRRDNIVNGKLRLRTEKTGTDVFCPLPGSVLKRLEDLKCTSPDYYFWTGTSKVKSAVGDWQRSLKRLFKLAGLRGHAHRFRHTFVKNLLMEGVPTERVAVLLGHRDSNIVLEHYSSWVKERQDQLEADVHRVWNARDRQKLNAKALKPLESAIQPLYGNSSKWLN